MISVEGESNEALVLDGEWFEKQRGGEPKARIAASTYRGREAPPAGRDRRRPRSRRGERLSFSR